MSHEEKMIEEVGIKVSLEKSIRVGFKACDLKARARTYPKKGVQ
jgi:hypothetical protein